MFPFNFCYLLNLLKNYKIPSYTQAGIWVSGTHLSLLLFPLHCVFPPNDMTHHLVGYQYAIGRCKDQTAPPHAHAHPHPPAHIHARVHARTHAHAHTHTHTHTHTKQPSFASIVPIFTKIMTLDTKISTSWCNMCIIKKQDNYGLNVFLD
jgi:hypothetical protein